MFGDVAGRVIINARAAYTLDWKGRWTFSLSGENLGDIRFWGERRPGQPKIWGDASTGESLGPRVFAAIDYAFSLGR
jgi:hypothetical protein